jgi:nucleoside-diphosphate-sugar epimerase
VGGTESPLNLLVTGGGGFIGSALVRRLVERNHTVASFSRGEYPEHRQLGLEVIRGDLSDQEAVMTACRNREIVFHTAAKVGVWGAYHDFYEPNVKGTENIINACLACGVKGLVFTSSASVVFDGTDIQGANESLPYPERPQSHYTATKALAEQAVLKADSTRLKTLSLRPHLVWGPGDPHIIPRIIALGRTGKVKRIGKENHIVDTTYIDNAVSAHLCAAEAILNPNGTGGKAFFISNGEPVPVWNFIDEILISAGLHPTGKAVSKEAALAVARILEWFYKAAFVKREPVLTRFTIHELCTAHWFDISAARQQLDYVPEVSIREGFNRLSRLASWTAAKKTI